MQTQPNTSTLIMLTAQTQLQPDPATVTALLQHGLTVEYRRGVPCLVVPMAQIVTVMEAVQR